MICVLAANLSQEKRQNCVFHKANQQFPIVYRESDFTL